MVERYLHTIEVVGSTPTAPTTSEKSSAGGYKTGRIRIIISRSHQTPELNEFIELKRKEYKDVELIVSGGTIKMCLVASGSADLYMRTTKTQEWDTAAGHIIALEGGAIIQTLSGEPFLYNKENLFNPTFLIRNKDVKNKKIIPSP